jgi:anion-transporting  ArsA/GET3 family ATPase
MNAATPPEGRGASQPPGPPSSEARPAPADVAGDLLGKRFITVIGKGGVGKTTIAAALAVMAARRGLRVLLTTVAAKDRLGDMLGCGPIGPKNREVWPGVDAVDMIPEVNLEEYALMTLKLRALYRLVIGNRVVQSLLAGVPGLYQWSLLGKATFHALELRPDGARRYDLVIFDSPATGHGLDLLRTPLTISEAIPAGPLREEALERWQMLTDPSQHEVLTVSIAEELAVTETVELLERLNRMGMAARTVIVNKMLPPLFAETDEALLQRLTLSGAMCDVVASGLLRAGWQRIQLEQLGRLRRLIDQRQVWLPHLLVSEMGPATITSLSFALEALLAPPPVGRPVAGDQPRAVPQA